MRDPGQDGAGGPEAKQARLTSSPQSVPQLFLMAQKGMSEPGGQCGVQAVRAPVLWSGPQALCTLQVPPVGLLCDRY